jgi:hypothetical protein
MRVTLLMLVLMVAGVLVRPGVRVGVTQGAAAM